MVRRREAMGLRRGRSIPDTVVETGKGSKKVEVKVYMPREQYEQLKKRAEEAGLSVSSYVRFILLRERRG